MRAGCVAWLVWLCIGCGARPQPHVGDRVVVSAEWGWDAHSCGYALPRLIADAHGEPVVGCRDGPVWGGAYTYALPFDRVMARIAYRFHYQVWVVFAIALLGLVIPAVWPQFSDPLGLRRAEARLLALRQTSAAAAPQRLATLHCPTCARPAPLIDADEIGCAGCRTMIAIPPEYHALASLRERAASDHAEAAQLWRTYDRVVGIALSPLVLVPATLVIAAEVLVATYGLANGMVHPAYRLFVPAIVIAVLMLGRTLWRMRVGRRAVARTPMILPADITGDALVCATCGAPMAVPPSSFVVASCLYCGTAHLLASRVQRRRAAGAARARTEATSLVDATAAMHRVLAGAARTMWQLSWLTLGLTVVFAVLASMHR